MERVSELIMRSAQHLGGGEILLLNPPRDRCFQSLAEMGGKVQIFTQDFGDFAWLKEKGADVDFGVVPSPAPQIRDIVFIQPRERARLHMLLHALAATISPTARLWLAGENRAGIKSSAKHLRTYFEKVVKTDSARHCTLFGAERPRPVDPFSLADYADSWSLPCMGGTIKLSSLPGTFARGTLDPGTKLLLACLEDLSVSDRVLDFACGNGVIGLALLMKNPSIALTLLDNSALALESTRRSLAFNQRKAELLASDGLSDLRGRFDWIVSNPPFHRGVAHDLGIVEQFCAGAAKFLTKEGRILLVCNHHLPYPGWLKTRFNQVETLRSNREFKVILATGIK